MSGILKQPTLPRWIWALLTLPVAIIVLGGYGFLRMQARQLQATTEANLAAIAQLKAQQISDWRLERLSDAVAFSNAPTFIAEVDRWMQVRQPEAEAEIMTRLKALEFVRQYSDVVLVDAAGQPRLSLTGRLLALDAEDRAALADVFQTGRPRFYDLHISSASGAIDMDVLAPLLSATGQPVGAVVLQIDPQRYLYPLLQAWPVSSASAESLLVRREGDEVVWLNNLRYQPGAALRMRMPLTATNVPAVMAALGRQGTFRGSDYRGVDVFSVLQPVPDSPWFLVAKEDSAEALSFLRPITGLVALSLACLLVAVGVTGGFAWQQVQKRYYRAIYAAEAERLALARHFEYLVKYANDIILLTDATFQVVEANDRALETYGYSRPEMLQLTLADLAAPEHGAIYHEHTRLLRATGSDRREAWQRRRDGSVFPAEVNARAIDIEGRSYYQGILRDISDRKRAEQVIQRQNEQLQAQNEELLAQQEELLESRAGLEARVRERTGELQNALAQEKAVRLQLIRAEKLSALGRMVSSVAHELNNPLQTITNCLYLTGQALAPNSPVHDYLEMAQAETRRLVNLVAQLRELYRMRPTSAPQRFRLGALLHQVQALLALPLQSANVRWQAPTALPDYAVEGSPDRLKQVFINLATNAIEAMRPAGGELRVGWAPSADGKQVGVSFQDTGPGIEPENLSRLFEPFFTTKDHGLGLGLSICHEIVQQHHGQIIVVSPPGQGAQFIVWLPLAAPDGA